MLVNGELAEHYYKIAIENGSTKAMVNLASLFIEGTIVTKDVEKGIELYEKACELKDVYAVYNLALLYYEGIARPRDMGRAVHFLEIGTSLNHPRSFNFLGCLYIEGNSVPRNILKAIEYFEKASDLNDKDAIFNLGVIHNDIGAKQEALKYFEKGALLGSGTNALKAAKIYEKGETVKKDLNKSKQYYKVGMYCKKSKEKESLESEKGFLRVIGVLFQEKFFKDQHLLDCIIITQEKQ